MSERLIDAEALDKTLEFYAAAYSPIDGMKERLVHDTIQSCRKHLQAAPTIEPKRGEWISVDGFYKRKCSICGKEKDLTDNFNYCPNCGADMRKE